MIQKKYTYIVVAIILSITVVAALTVTAIPQKAPIWRPPVGNATFVLTCPLAGNGSVLALAGRCSNGNVTVVKLILNGSGMWINYTVNGIPFAPYALGGSWRRLAVPVSEARWLYMKTPLSKYRDVYVLFDMDDVRASGGSIEGNFSVIYSAYAISSTVFLLDNKTLLVVVTTRAVGLHKPIKLPVSEHIKQYTWRLYNETRLAHEQAIVDVLQRLK
ncbi:hypothetical protein TUZN_0094 [Thermoproteus uzoniensis 768-20]|uniref:Uncharacterized protein n=1 Tax=Thermoproteus uzoniensis (strain 768-20) TaxID=999630 RepID=F2L148_THEU7|nr:hypothetical protein [Thermoproteus uzoniensis]AEA11597.1 hypothetical protein TUZN_0094 [Thermoproteus uzoniensis 768-20]